MPPILMRLMPFFWSAIVSAINNPFYVRVSAYDPNSEFNFLARRGFLLCLRIFSRDRKLWALRSPLSNASHALVNVSSGSSGGIVDGKAAHVSLRARLR